MRGGLWTAERIDLLKRLWGEGQSAAAIGERLGGLSRSAVLGKVFRLRLLTKDAETSSPAKQETAAVARSAGAGTLDRRRRSPERRKEVPPPPVRRTQHKSLLELTNNTWTWSHIH